MRAPERAETKAVELVEIPYKQNVVVAAKMSDGSVRGLDFNGLSIALRDGQMSLYIPSDCNGRINIDDNDDTDDTFIPAELGFNTCYYDPANGISAAVQIQVGDVLFVRPADGFMTPDDYVDWDLSEFVKQ